MKLCKWIGSQLQSSSGKQSHYQCTDTHWPLRTFIQMRFVYRRALRCVFQSSCTTMCLPSGKPSGQPSASLPVTLSSSSPWRWWKSTGTSSWRTTWTSRTSSSSSMVTSAASRQIFATPPQTEDKLFLDRWGRLVPVTSPGSWTEGRENMK